MRNRGLLPDWPASMRRDLAAAYLDITPSTLDRIVAEGRLPAGLYLTPGSKVWLKQDLDALLAKLAGRPNDPATRPVEALVSEWDQACDGAREAALS